MEKFNIHLFLKINELSTNIYFNKYFIISSEYTVFLILFVLVVLWFKDEESIVLYTLIGMWL